MAVINLRSLRQEKKSLLHTRDYLNFSPITSLHAPVFLSLQSFLSHHIKLFRDQTLYKIEETCLILTNYMQSASQEGKVLYTVTLSCGSQEHACRRAPLEQSNLDPLVTRTPTRLTACNLKRATYFRRI